MKTDTVSRNKKPFSILGARILLNIILIFLGIFSAFMMPGCREKLPEINDRIVSNETDEIIAAEEPLTLTLKPLDLIKPALKEPDEDGAELLGVRFAADGGYIMVEFKSPRELAQNWNEGSIFLLDEKTGITYWDIPQVPILGLLLGRPLEEGQKGYAMFKNIEGGIKPGSVLTVVLGDYKREHISIK
jgi:hypothetical protein